MDAAPRFNRCNGVCRQLNAAFNDKRIENRGPVRCIHVTAFSHVFQNRLTIEM